MGASDDGDGGGIGLDCSVGTIVWVRRRNGSWWPGRILGPEELSASHLMSPRSGTPVKLLGREDASVDWYNLEKSKRVKPFRCGEFDACIERAEASQGAPIKKREKYARREDAILHALELEKKQLEMKQQKSGIVSNGVTSKPFGQKKGNTFLSSDILTKNDYSANYSKYGGNKIKKTSLHEEENRNKPMFLGNGKSGKVIRWEENSTEAMPRMRGLQDFGLRIAPKKKPPPSAVWETSKHNPESKMDAFSPIGGATHTMAMKRKRSSGTTEDSLGKKRDRRRPLVQVLQSTAKLESSHATQLDDGVHSVPIQGEKDDPVVVCRAKRSRCVYLPADSNDSVQHGIYHFGEASMTQFEMDNCFDGPDSLTKENASSMINEPDSSETEYLESEMEEGEEMDLLVDAGQSTSSGPGDCELAVIQASDKVNTDNFEMAISGDMNEIHPHEHSEDASPEVGVSKWHLKGKRNSRNLVRRLADNADDKTMSSDKCNGSPPDTSYRMKGNSFQMREMELSSQWMVGHGSDHGKRSVHYASGISDMISEDSGQDEMIGYSKQRHSSLLARDHGRSHNKYMILEDDGRYPVSRSYWDDCDDPMYTTYLSKGRGETLVDVDLKVERSYHGERVPLVSLMSRLNGKAIIGHPIQVEILEHGSTDQFFSGNRLDDSSATQPVWRTARRTAMQRIPRSNPIASSMEGDEVGTFSYPERESKPLTNKYSGHQARLVKQSYLNIRKRSSKKHHKKSSKKASSSNQKTRTLSSFAFERKLGSENRDFKLARSSGILGGLMKPEGTMPLVTCVPVKVAFSRILEAVGRPSSTAAHRARMASPAIRDPC